jgi:hypothetical protein
MLKFWVAKYKNASNLLILRQAAGILNIDVFIDRCLFAAFVFGSQTIIFFTG